MSSRTLNGLNASNVYVNSMFSDGQAITITQVSNTTQAQVDIDISKQDQNSSPSATDWFVIEENSGGSIKKISYGDLTDTFATLTGTQTLTNKTLTTPQISELSGSEVYTLAGGSISANRKITLPALGGDDIMVCEAFAQTLTNKTLTTPMISELSGSEVYTIAGGSISANRKITLPALGGDDIMVCEAFAQTLSNKTLDATCSYTSPEFNEIIIFEPPAEGTKKYTIKGGALADDRIITLPNLTGNDILVTADFAQTLTNKALGSGCTYTSPTFNEIILTEQGGGTTKFTIQGAAIANPQTVTIPNIEADVNFVMTATANAQTVSNLILTSPTINACILDKPTITDKDGYYFYNITSPSNLTGSRDINLPLLLDDDTMVLQNHIQTLVGKTLTSPTISTIINSGTLTLPTATTTLVGTNTTDTLTNKTLSGNVCSNLLTSPSAYAVNIPAPTGAGQTLLTNTGLTTMTNFGTDTTDADVYFGDLDNGTTTINADIMYLTSNIQQFTLNGSSGSGRVKVWFMDAKEWIWTGDATGSGSWNTYSDLISVLNPVKDVSYPASTNNYPKLQLKLENTYGAGLFLKSNASGYCEWANLSTITEWNKTSGNLYPLATTTDVVVGASTNPYNNKFYVVGTAEINGELWCGPNGNVMKVDATGMECYEPAYIGGALYSGNNAGFYITKSASSDVSSSDTWRIYQGTTGDCHWDWGDSGTQSGQGYVKYNTGDYIKMNMTGQHRCITENQTIKDNINDYVGMVVIATGSYNSIIHDNKQDDPSTDVVSINEAQPIVELSNNVKDKRVFGVISDIETKDKQRDWGTGVFMSVVNKKILNERLFINSIGEGGIKVCNSGGHIYNGDLLCSSEKSGLAMRQDDDLVHNYTIGKATQDYIFLSNVDYRLIGCCYYCG